MQYRILGRSGISVSEVSFGSHLRRSNIENPRLRRAQIHAGLERGINLFDIYEHSYSQFAPMSEALDSVRNQVVISLVTVWRAADEVMEEVEYSLRVFKRERIELYRVYFSGNWEDSEQRMAALGKAKEQGKIQAIGGVVHSPEVLLESLRRYPQLEYLMAPACFCATRLIHDGVLVSEIRKAGVGVIAMKPMGAADGEGGYVFKLNPSGREIEALRARVSSLGRLAVKYLLQSNVVASVLPAMNSVEEVLENAGASGDGPLSENEARFLRIYREEADRSFPSMLPENDYWITPWKM